MRRYFLFMFFGLFVCFVPAFAGETREELFIKKLPAPSKVEQESPEFKLSPWEQKWVVVHIKEVKTANSSSVDHEQFSLEDLGISNPETITQEELKKKFEAFDEKRRAEAQKVRCVIQECHGLDLSCGFVKGG